MTSNTYHSTLSAVFSWNSHWYNLMPLHYRSNCCSWSLHCTCCSLCILYNSAAIAPCWVLISHHTNPLGTCLTSSSDIPQIFFGIDVDTAHLGRQWPAVLQQYGHLAGCSWLGQLWSLHQSLWFLNWRTGNHGCSLLTWEATCHWYCYLTLHLGLGCLCLPCILYTCYSSKSYGQVSWLLQLMWLCNNGCIWSWSGTCEHCQPL